MPSQTRNVKTQDKPVYPHYLKLGRFIKNTIEQHGYTIKSFSDKIKKPANATLHQIIRGQQKSIGSDLLANIAKGLSEISGEKIDTQTLINLIEQPKESSNRGIDNHEHTDPKHKPASEILPASVLLWHFRRLPQNERIGTWGEFLNPSQPGLETLPTQESGIDAAEVRLGRHPKIDILIGLINELSDRHKLRTIGELADWLLESFPEARETDRLTLIEGLNQITTFKQIPDFEEDCYQAIVVLAIALGYSSDLDLLEYCGLYRGNGANNHR